MKTQCVCVFACYISSIISYKETTCWVNDYVPGKALQDGWRCGWPVIKRSCLDISHIATVLTKHTQPIHCLQLLFNSTHTNTWTDPDCVFERKSSGMNPCSVDLNTWHSTKHLRERQNCSKACVVVVIRLYIIHFVFFLSFKLFEDLRRTQIYCNWWHKPKFGFHF